MAWQIGVRKFEKQMKKSSNRKNYIFAFVNDRKYHERVRRLVRKSMLGEEETTTLTELLMLFVSFLSSTQEGDRVIY